MKHFTVTIYGLIIDTELELPELLPAQGAADVVVRFGKLPEHLDHPLQTHELFEVGPEGFLLKAPEAGYYLISAGRNICIDPLPGVSPERLRLFLLGSALGIILHQRGLLPIHGSAIATQQGAVIFTGPSGVGKSTRAHAFAGRGYRLLADDVCAITLQGQIPILMPAYPQLKLWGAALKHLEKETQSLTRILPEEDKYGLPLGQAFQTQSTPLYAVYALIPGSETAVHIQPLTGLDKLQTLVANTYRVGFLAALDGLPNQFRQASALGKHTRVCRVTRPEQGFYLNELTDCIERDFTCETIEPEEA